MIEVDSFSYPKRAKTQIPEHVHCRDTSAEIKENCNKQVDEAILFETNTQCENSDLSTSAVEKAELHSDAAPPDRPVNEMLNFCSPFPELCDFGDVAYLRSARYCDLSPNIERNGNRAILVDSLINALGIARYLDVVEVIPANRQQLAHFHNTEYISALENPHLLSNRKLRKFGLVDDCPVFEDMFELACLG